jgi:hypothetical protein
MIPEQLCEVFDINMRKKGAKAFIMLSWLLVDGMSIQEAMGVVCYALRMPRAAVYTHAKRALQPVFEANDAKLEVCGLKRPNTVSGLARQIAGTISDINQE